MVPGVSSHCDLKMTIGPALPGMGAVGVGNTLLWEHPSGEAPPYRLYRTTLRRDPDRRARRTAPFRSSFLPYISFASGAGSFAHRLVIGGSTHVSMVLGVPLPKTTVGELLRSGFVLFITYLFNSSLCSSREFAYKTMPSN